jgi:homoserine kinase
MSGFMPNVQTIRVPASSANLGSGFDTLGLALAIYLHCEFQRSEQLEISAEGRDTKLIPLDETNLIWQTARGVAERHGLAMPPIRLRIENEIPVGKGLGSSAAALIAGIAIADRVLEMGWNAHRILDEAARLEGHPDNVAAAVLGSVVTATIGSDGVTRAVRLDIPDRFAVAVVCPDLVLSTSHMRTVLPDCYSKEDAVFNLQRATLLVGALATGDPDVFPEALEDRLHQPYRLSLVPGMEAILKLRAPGLLGCALSGAGPAMLVFYQRGSDAVLELVRTEFQRAGQSSEIVVRGADREGLRFS